MKNLFVVNTPFHLLSAFILTHTVYRHDDNYLVLVRSHGYDKWADSPLMTYLSSTDSGWCAVFPLIHWLSSKKKDNPSFRQQAKTVQEQIGSVGIDEIFLGCDVDPYDQLLVATLGKESFWRLDDGMYSYSYAEKRRNRLHQLFHQLKAVYMKRQMGIKSSLPINTTANGDSPAGKGDILYLPQLLTRYSPCVREITAEEIAEAMAELEEVGLYRPICPTEDAYAIYLSQGSLAVEEEVKILANVMDKLAGQRLIYKPHPNDSADKLQYIGEHMMNVVLCDSKIPVEVMLSMEKNIKTVIGYQSTTLALAGKFTGRDIDCISIAKLYTKREMNPVYFDMLQKMQVRFIEP